MGELLAYPLLAALGMIASAFVWERVRGRDGRSSPPRWDAIFLGALIGMAAGAKLGYALAEGVWGARASSAVEWWSAVFAGKTVLGGLLGAYAGVEIAKRRIGYSEPTGDTFALMAPLSLMFGRAGCVVAGCCQGIEMAPSWFTLADDKGVERWPAAWIELAFNALLFAVAAAWTVRSRRRGPGRWDGQMFHLYLIGYGGFRFVHELMRDTPVVVVGLTGYQVLAAAVFVLGGARLMQRDAALRSRHAQGG
jgi:phosphatidylglycerol---prolipoprotein diacylglyceryl transferase